MVGNSNYTWTGGGSSGSSSGSGSGPPAPSGPPSGSDQNASAPRAPSANNNLQNLQIQNREDSHSNGETPPLHHVVVRRDFFRAPLSPDDMSVPDDRPWYMR